MRKYQLANWALLLLLAGLALLIIETLRRVDQQGRTESWLKPDEHPMQRIRIHRPGIAAIEIQRQGQSWRMISPMDLPADSFRIERMLNDLLYSEPTPVPAEEKDWAVYGLEHPRAQIWLDQHQIAFGLVNVLNYQRYFLHQGQVYLAEDHTLPLLQGQELFFADHSLLPAGFHPIFIEIEGQRLNLEQGDETISAEQGLRTAGAWINARASLVERLPEDADAITDLWLENREAERIRFALRSNAPDLSLARPDMGIQYRFNLGTGSALIPAEIELPTPPAGAPAEDPPQAELEPHTEPG